MSERRTTNTGIIRMIGRLNALALKPVRIRVHPAVLNALKTAWLDDGDTLIGAMVDTDRHTLFDIPFIDDEMIPPGSVHFEIAANLEPETPGW